MIRSSVKARILAAAERAGRRGPSAEVVAHEKAREAALVRNVRRAIEGEARLGPPEAVPPPHPDAPPPAEIGPELRRELLAVLEACDRVAAGGRPDRGPPSRWLG